MDSLDGASTASPVPHMWVGRLTDRVERVRARRGLRAARRAADAELATRQSPPLRLAWRAQELVSTKSRLDLAHALRTLVRDASPRYLPSASPLNRVAVRAESQTLVALADRLAELDRPVAARGIVLLHRLLTDPSGPLYDTERAEGLASHLARARRSLEES